MKNLTLLLFACLLLSCGSKNSDPLSTMIYKKGQFDSQKEKLTEILGIDSTMALVMAIGLIEGMQGDTLEGKTYREIIDHMESFGEKAASTDDKNASDSENEYNIWKGIDITDNFGDPTGKKTYIKLVKGKFSNSAVDGANLTAIIRYEEGFMAIRLLEYDNMKATIPEEKFITIDIKIPSGEVKRVELFCYNDFISSTDGKLENVFKENPGELKFFIDFERVSKMYNSTYNFSVNNELPQL